jgi:hypothetical protein
MYTIYGSSTLYTPIRSYMYSKAQTDRTEIYTCNYAVSYSYRLIGMSYVSGYTQVTTVFYHTH